MQLGDEGFRAAVDLDAVTLDNKRYPHVFSHRFAQIFTDYGCQTL